MAEELENQLPAIVVDGPGGAGKSSLSRWLAASLGFHLLDSGALYRCLALAAREEGVDLMDSTGLAALASALDIEFRETGKHLGVFWQGRDRHSDIRSEEVAALASKIAVLPAVRQSLVARQRRFLRPPGLVAEGRDMGTQIFPDADLKVFLKASPAERARRRCHELSKAGKDARIDEIYDDLSRRDEIDTNRDSAPLQPAADARHFDTTGLDLDEVCQQVLKWAEAALRR